MNLIISFAVLIVTMLFGLPIPIAFFSTCIYLLLAEGMDPSFMIPYGMGQINSYIIIAVPMFILAGAIMEKGGIGDKLVSFVERATGRVKGGIGLVTIIACGIFGAISGSATATVTAIGSIMQPRLEKSGYSRGMSASLIASAGILGMLIPPSGIMIMFCWVANQSVLAAFLSSAMAGITLIVFLSIVNLVLAARDPNIKVQTKEDVARMKKERKNPWAPVPALLMPIIILGGIYGGIMTPVEAAAMAVLYAIPCGVFIYREINGKTLKEICIKAGRNTGIVMGMLFAVTMLCRIYTVMGLPQEVLSLMTGISTNKYVLLFLINIFMIIIGMLMDDGSATLLVTPLLMPLIRNIGVDPIHFAAILGTNLGLGCITPPTAPILYLAGTLADSSLKEMIGPTMKFIIFAWLPTLFIVTYFPDYVLWLPRLVIGYGG